MATKEFHYRKGEHEVDVSIDYRMPTKQEFLSIAGLISLIAGICFIAKAVKLNDPSQD